MSLDDLNREQKRHLRRTGALDEKGAPTRVQRQAPAIGQVFVTLAIVNDGDYANERPISAPFRDFPCLLEATTDFA